STGRVESKTDDHIGVSCQRPLSGTIREVAKLEGVIPRQFYDQTKVRADFDTVDPVHFSEVRANIETLEPAGVTLDRSHPPSSRHFTQVQRILQIDASEQSAIWAEGEGIDRHLVPGESSLQFSIRNAPKGDSRVFTGCQPLPVRAKGKARGRETGVAQRQFPR